MTKIITPGSIIGIIGGGQLGRMTALSAANLGYKTHIYCPEADSPASHVATHTTVASYDDVKQLEAFARAVDVITFEFENIPAKTVQLLAGLTLVRPGWKVLHIAQNRLREKEFITECGIDTTRYASISSVEDLMQAVKTIGVPSILKTTEQGYDGKGQFFIRKVEEAESLAASGIFDNAPEGSFVLEAFVDYVKEISVVLARSASGEVSCFPPAENKHIDGILATSTVPADIDAALVKQAQAFTRIIAEKLELVGMLAVEFFVTRDNRLLVNEMAPRPHNSGHWTMDACITSQFEQFARAVCGLPLGSVIAHSRAVMQNLIGDDIKNWPEFTADPQTKLHIYGKETIKEGRKMGHVTRIVPYATGENSCK